MDAIESGTLGGIGSFRCQDCAFVVTLAADDELPTCPGCGGTEFERASLFSGQPQFSGRPWPEQDADDVGWIDEAREGVTEPGRYLAYRSAKGDVTVFSLSKRWTRIGRSLAADIRFDDPTVSRRHALLVHQADGVRVLDDRSLNGVFVNGERVEWSTLADGDEILLGCHSLRYLFVAAVAAGTSEAARHSAAGA
jgi:hypothetical protein